MKTIENVQEFVEYSKRIQEEDIYSSVQVDLLGEDKKLEFTDHLLSVADINKVDVLDASKSWRRQPTDMCAKEALSNMSNINVLKSGIKIFHKTPFKYYEWANWDGGYIEGFTCFGEEPEYFIWAYIKMPHLELILSKFKNSLIDYRK